MNDLKATHGALLEVVNAKDAKGFAGLLHEEVVFLFPDVLFPHRPRRGMAARVEGFTSVCAHLDTHRITIDDPHYVVVGNTGIVWWFQHQKGKWKEQDMESSWSRSTFTYVKTAGKWLLLGAQWAVAPWKHLKFSVDDPPSGG